MTVVSRAVIDGEKARRSLRLFIKEAWSVIEPATPMLSNWHIDCVADHLQAVFFGQITRLLVNIQPGVAKSTIFSTMWPTWCWTNDPSSRWLCASHSLDLAIRDNKNCRDLIQSDWYQERYGHLFQLKGDQNVKSYFETSARGYRVAAAVRSSTTGKRASHQLIDDPNNAMAGQADMDATIDWFSKSWLSRLNDQEHGASVVVGQRLHEKDLSGHILSLGGWQHLCIPTEYEPARKFSTYLPGTKFAKQHTVDVASHTVLGKSYKVVFEDGNATNCTCEARLYHPETACKHMQHAHVPAATPFWTDPRTREGELLWPAKFPKSVLDKFKFDMGAMTYAAQFQQSQVPLSGGKFHSSWFRYFLETDRAYVLEIPGQGLKSILKTSCRLFGTVDLAISEKQSADFTVFCLWAVTPAQDLLLLHVYRAHCSNAEQLAQLHKLHLFYQPDYWKIETVAYQMAFYQQALLMGIASRPFKPDRDKERRATTAAVWSENGKAYWRKDADWLPAWEAELLTFPRGAHDDQVDNYSIAADDINTGGVPLAGDEPPDEPPVMPTLAHIAKIDPFTWLEEHGGGWQ